MLKSSTEVPEKYAKSRNKIFMKYELFGSQHVVSMFHSKIQQIASYVFQSFPSRLNDLINSEMMKLPIGKKYYTRLF